MSFQPKSSGTGTDHSELVSGIIANSATVAVGEFVTLSSTGFVTNGGADAAGLGIVIGFEQGNGLPLAAAAYTPGTAGGTDVQSVVAASDNQTVAKYRAIVQTSMDAKYSVNVNGTLGTTNGSPTSLGVIGGYVNVDSANSNYARVLETTFERADGTDNNFTCWGVDPADATRLIVSLANSVKICSAQ